MTKKEKTKDELLEELNQLQKEFSDLKRIVGIENLERKQIVEEFKLSEQRYHALIELAVEGILIGSNQGIVIEANKQICTILSLPKESIIGKHISEMPFTPESIEKTPLRFDLLRKGNVVVCERIVMRPDSTEIVVEMHTKMMPDGTYQSIFIDITERNKTQEKLRMSEEKFRKAFITNPDSININRVSDGLYVSINRGFTQITGYTEKEVFGKTSLELNIWADPNDRLTLTEGLNTNGYVGNLEAQFKAKSGSIIDGLMSASIIELEGTPHIISITRDITHRKKAELDLQEKATEIEAQNEEYQQLNEDLVIINEKLNRAKENAESVANLLYNITDNLPAFVAVVDAKSLKYKFVNLKFINGFNKKREEIVGFHIADIIGKDKADFAMKYIEEVRQGNSSSYINTFDVAEGKRYFNVNYVPGFNDKKEVSEIIVLTFDITDLKKSEQELLIAKEKAEESDRLKTAFLQNMSHEIRTPMNAIMGFSDLLRYQHDDNAEIEQYCEIINQRSHDLLDIINDILDVAKIESGQLPINLEQCSIPELFDELDQFFKELQKRIDKQHINFQMQCSFDFGDHSVTTDKVKLKQILINLINNAFKFTEVGEIKGGCKLDSNNNILFYISDTGIGIPLEKQKIIFERFAQLHQNPNKNIGGTGLGLSIVKGLVNLLEGEIFLDSELGKGSTFSFRLPNKKVSN